MNDNLKRSEDCLVIGYDKDSVGKDCAGLLVLRKFNGKTEIVNTFYNDEAEQLYQKLIRQK